MNDHRRGNGECGHRHGAVPVCKADQIDAEVLGTFAVDDVIPHLTVGHDINLDKLRTALRAQPQPQAPPQQPPPADGSADPAAPVERPVTAIVDSSFTVSECPDGQVAGSDDSAMGRDCSNVAPHARQRYSYRGMAPG